MTVLTPVSSSILNGCELQFEPFEFLGHHGSRNDMTGRADPLQKPLDEMFIVRQIGCGYRTVVVTGTHGYRNTVLKAQALLPSVET